MADDKIPFDEYTFEPDLSVEDEVLQELERIIGETEARISAVNQEPSTEQFAAQLEAVPDPASGFDAGPADASSILPDAAALEEAPAQEEPAAERLEEVIVAIDRALDRAEPVEVERYDAHLRLDAPERIDQYLVFSLGGIKYAVPANGVVEIGRVPPTTPVPNTPPWLLGVTNRRGDILSVVDLRGFLGMDGRHQREMSRIVVVRSNSDEMMAGLIVDQVNGMLNVAPGGVEPPAGPIDTTLAPYLLGLCEHKKDLVAVLELELLLASPEMRQFELV
jgi:purine-binding chemotaxis protein CheW